MKTKFLAVVVAAMFPLGAIAQTPSDSYDSTRMNTAQGPDYSDSSYNRMQSRNESKGFFHRHMRADGNTRSFPSDSGLQNPNAHANGVVPDQGVALGLTFGAD